MANGRGQHEWQQTGSMLALIANVHRDPKRRSEPFKVADFDPYAKRKEPEVVKVPFSTFMAIAKQLWCKGEREPQGTPAIAAEYPSPP